MIKKILDLLICLLSVIGIGLTLYFVYYVVTNVFPLLGI